MLGTLTNLIAKMSRALAARAVGAAALTTVSLWAAAGSSAGAQPQVSTIQNIVRGAMTQYHLKALIVQVRSGGSDVYTAAFGESMSGVPATPDMHFRNGAMAFTYMSTMLLEFVDQRKVTLDTKLSRFRPDLPYADRITLKNLANMTSGYADYVYQPELLKGTTLYPFRQWTPAELIRIGITKPMMFEPGTNWGYSHTNYVILADVLEKLAGMPLNDAMHKYVFGPMGLTQTDGFVTPHIPEPVLHAFSSEQRQDLGVKPSIPFYEESTFWNPSWTTSDNAVQTTDITDMSKSMEAVGNGKLLSPSSFAAQVGPNLVGFGHSKPGCAVCRQNTTAFNYGLGVVILGPWIEQTKSFAGCSASVGYLPAQKLTIAVAVTYLPEAFDAQGNYKDASVSTFRALVAALAPNTMTNP
jgi:CubicO group peptidase (beta-lactamase class C family)